MVLASDCNTIFAYSDSSDKHHNSVAVFFKQRSRVNYLVLFNVKTSFIYTYSDVFKECGLIVEKVILEQKEHRKRSPSKSYKPSHFVITLQAEKQIEQELESISKKRRFNRSLARRFISKLLSKYSIPSLYEDDEIFANFREEYLKKSEEQATEVLNKFLRLFRSFDTITMEEYEQYHEWLNRIKQCKLNVFRNLQDYEDMKIGAEYLSYNEEFGTLDFATCDKDCHKSIHKLSRKYQQRIGKLHYLNRTTRRRKRKRHRERR